MGDILRVGGYTAGGRHDTADDRSRRDDAATSSSGHAAKMSALGYSRRQPAGIIGGDAGHS